MQTAANSPAVNPDIWYKAELCRDHVENTYVWFHPRTPESKFWSCCLFAPLVKQHFWELQSPGLCREEKKDTEKTKSKSKNQVSNAFKQPSY